MYVLLLICIYIYILREREIHTYVRCVLFSSRASMCAMLYYAWLLIVIMSCVWLSFLIEFCVICIIWLLCLSDSQGPAQCRACDYTLCLCVYICVYIYICIYAYIYICICIYIYI